MPGSAQQRALSARIRRLASRVGRWDELNPRLSGHRERKAVQRRCALGPWGAHTSGHSEQNRHHAIRASTGRNCGWGIFTTPKPTAEPCWPGCRGLRHLLFFVHASTDMYNESCARRLYEARIHGRGLPAWYGGVALKAPQKRRGGSACECRPEKVSLRRVYWGHAGPTAWRGHHGSPHA